MSERLYEIAKKQAETSRAFGRQARQECSEEEAVAILNDYVRLWEAFEQEKDHWVATEAKLAEADREISRLNGSIGGMTKKINRLEREAEEYQDLIAGMGADLDDEETRH